MYSVVVSSCVSYINKFLSRLVIAHMLLLVPNALLADTAPLRQLEAKRELFLKAEAALAEGKLSFYQKIKARLLDYPLLPYLLFSEYEKRITAVSHQEFQSFMDNYPDSTLSEQLRYKWLNLKAKQEDWKGFIQAYQPSQEVSLQCHYLWASLQTQKDKEVILKQAQALWLSGKQPPKSCEQVFAVWEKSGAMTHSLVWQRIKLLIQEGQDNLARRMSKYLKKSEVALVELWLMIHNNPYLVTQRKYFAEKHPAHLEMIVDGVSLIAKTKPEIAIRIWQQIGHQYKFTERHWGLVVRAIGLAFALQRNPEAEKWLSKVPAIYCNAPVHEWRVRISLSKEDWPMVLQWVKHMPETLAKAEEWQYWKARGLERINQRPESQAILEKLTKSRSYYGFLASHLCLKPFTIPHQKIVLERSMIEAMARRPSILRARELQALGRFGKARCEWQFVTGRMSDKEKHAAANLAIRWNLPNWSILALAKATNKDDLALRFPVVFGQHIVKEANRNQIDPALIFAVTRQESAFVPHAKSSSGALGLMQLIPSTAQMVAKKHKVTLGHHKELFEPLTNIQLGSGYLKMMLDNHQNNTVLATAAYNAGPGRVRRWLPTFDMPADIWIETIPYKETREYVKNVMTYTVIYQEILGKKPTLTRHMPYIPKKME